MSASSDAADQIVKITLDTVQTAAKISGDGALEIAKLLIRELKMPQKKKGKASLKSMLKSQKPIKVFEIDDKSLRKFCEEAKRYGVVYHVLKDKSNNNGKCDIMVRAEDASKVNRIFERYKLGVNQKATIKSTITKDKKSDLPIPEKEQPEKSAEDKFIDELFNKPPNKEKTDSVNPPLAKTGKVDLSERSSINSDHQSTDSPTTAKEPVRKRIERIKNEKDAAKKDAKKPQQTKHNNKSNRRKDHGRSK